MATSPQRYLIKNIVGFIVSIRKASRSVPERAEQLDHKPYFQCEVD
jgi:hypothetical protein